MNRLAKNISVCFLLALVSSPFVAPFIMVIQQQYAVHVMAEKLENESLQTIVIENDRLQWIVAGKECLIDGKRFDVKKSSQKGNLVMLTGLIDEEETRIEHLIESSSGDTQKNNAGLIYGYTQLLAEENPVAGLNIYHFLLSDRRTDHRFAILSYTCLCPDTSS